MFDTCGAESSLVTLAINCGAFGIVSFWGVGYSLALPLESSVGRALNGGQVAVCRLRFSRYLAFPQSVMAGKIDKERRFYAAGRAEWRAWLEANHAAEAGIWLVYPKKGSDMPRVEYADAVEEALCFGWIDSVINGIDEHRYMQLFTPRKPKSTWSQLNKVRVERLAAEGLMCPAGLKCIEVARANGSWESIDHVEALVPSADFEAAMAASPGTRAFFDALSNTNKKYILHHLNNARLEATRRLRMTEVLEAFAAGKMPDRYLRKPANP